VAWAVSTAITIDVVVILVAIAGWLFPAWANGIAAIILLLMRQSWPYFADQATVH
jgi:hypothetical protein